MSKSKIVIDKLAKILEQGMINSKDFSEELKSILRFKKDEFKNKLDFVSKDEFEVLKQRLDKLESKINKILKKKNKSKKAKKS
jgi:BMFP domain-containing protein YqiC|tara:strand:+ start:1045 stop:1293 length:249 start_codon:yes stop_codon:yes gene_type:complete